MDYDEEYNEEDFEDEGSQMEKGVFKASYVVVAIDTHSSMFTHEVNKPQPFRSCLEACLRILDSLIFVTDKKHWNPFAVMLNRPEPGFIDFGDNIIASVTLLKSKLKLTDEELENEFQQKGDFDLAEFFLQCKRTFHNIKAAFYKRTLIYITNNDNPVCNAQAKFAAINEVKLFEASEITFQVIPTNDKFNFSLFFNEMLALLTQDSENSKQYEEYCTDVDGLEQKLSSVLLPSHFKTKVAFYPFKNDTEKCLTCFDLKIIQTKKLLNTTVSPEGKSVILKQPPLSDTLPTFKVESDNESKFDIKFDSLAKASLYDASYQRGYTLIYIGKSLLDPVYSFGKPRILQQHPSEKTGYFKKFWQYCVDNERVLVCVVKHKQPAAIKFCQMSPILFGDVSTFVCKIIPFGNYIAPSYDFLSLPPKTEYEETHINVVRKMVDKLTVDFHPNMLPDPCYRKKMQYIKSKLLGEPFKDDIKVFDRSLLDKQITSEVAEINEEFPVAHSVTAKGKRKTPASQTKSSKKRK